jgi:hypothetical protein
MSGVSPDIFKTDIPFSLATGCHYVIPTLDFSRINSSVNPSSLCHSALEEPAPYLIRGNPVSFWIPAYAGMTKNKMTKFLMPCGLAE